ncbi:hypothetical protein L2E82_22073 [Cichorium intybus]|uniref:Uncharacterized protein n=1 Tax=Cichorium intybus TaxID=13427 RepID=A0ACB9DX78_CICIN|nr:hypothetical protein L2E82_22073 [Cichorium intybus]
MTARKVPILYYLTRNGQLEHPHLIDVPLSSPHGLYLRVEAASLLSITLAFAWQKASLLSITKLPNKTIHKNTIRIVRQIIELLLLLCAFGSAMTDQEAASELEYLGRIKILNLVPLMGYCLASEQRIAIYDDIENISLHNLLYDLRLGVQVTED